jgi:uncharacterized protein (DUF433 family)
VLDNAVTQQYFWHNARGGEVRWQDYISVDPEIAHGKAYIRDTRIPVAVVLANLAAGLAPEDVFRSYPGLTPEAILASLAYAAELARERVIALPA